MLSLRLNTGNSWIKAWTGMATQEKLHGEQWVMDRSETINVGAVKRETKLKELWKEAKCIMAGVKSSYWRGSGGGFMFTRVARRDGLSARTMIDARCNWRDD